jgi:S1-C subfamily serine protease
VDCPVKYAKSGAVHIGARVRVAPNALLDNPFFRQFFDIPQVPREIERQSLGSGVIVDAAAGLVLTSQHVIANAEEIDVTLPDGELRAATSLAAFLESDGRAHEAHGILAPVHAWFTEGHDTGDLGDAAAVLARVVPHAARA